jgi:hypothetical protein
MAVNPSAVAVYNESRSLTPSGATFTDSFAAYEAHVYQVDGAGGGGSGVIPADHPAYITAGALRCGWAQWPNSQVHIWCYSGTTYTPETLVCNKLDRLSTAGPIFESCNLPTTKDIVSWAFGLTNGKLTWNVTSNGAPLETTKAMLYGLDQNLLPIDGLNGPELITVEWANVTFLRGPKTNQSLIRGGQQ